MKRNVEEAAVMVQKNREQFATSAFFPVSNDSSELFIVVHRCYPFVFAWLFCVFPVFGWFVALWFGIILRGFGVFFSVALPVVLLRVRLVLLCFACTWLVCCALFAVFFAMCFCDFA